MTRVSHFPGSSAVEIEGTSPSAFVNLITIREALAQVGADHDLDNDLIERMRADASGIILEYLGITGSPPRRWVDLLGEPKQVPRQVRAATLLVLAALYENRDGEETRDGSAPQPLSPAVQSLLARTRMPGFA